LVLFSVEISTMTLGRWTRIPSITSWS